MLSDSELIRREWDLGHFFSPEALKLELVEESDLSKLSIDDAVVKAATRSMQQFMSPVMDAITVKKGLQLTTYTGDVDEVTREMAMVPRCGEPDFLHPAKMKAIGSGSWPQPCQKTGVKVHFDISRKPASINIETLKAAVFGAYAAVGLKMIEVVSANLANIQVYWTPLPGSTIGIAQFNNQSCSNQVYCKLDTGYTGYIRGLLLHEMGHNCNLQHTRGGIMHPSIQPDPNPFGWNKDDPSYPVLVRFFGGEPVTPIPDPGPTPTPGALVLELPVKLTDAKGREFNLGPWPKV